MKDSEVVAAARELISDPERWVKGIWCTGSPGAVKLCAEGAVRMVLGEYEWRYEHWMFQWKGPTPQSWRIQRELADVAEELFPDVRQRCGPDDEFFLRDYNDASGITHGDVLAIFDKTHAKMVEEGR